jgi:hypothetical protein
MVQANTVAIPVEHLRHVHEIETCSRSEGESDADSLSFLDLVEAVAEFSDTEQEVVATVMHMLRSGRVQLRGGYTEPAATKLCG